MSRTPTQPGQQIITVIMIKGKKKECGPTLSGGMNEKTDHGFIHIIERNIRPGE